MTLAGLSFPLSVKVAWLESKDPQSGKLMPNVKENKIV